MRTPLFAACLSLSLAACGGPPLPESAPELATGALGPTAPASLADVRTALAALPSARVLGTHEDGLPFMVQGDFGQAEGFARGLSAREALGRVDPRLSAVAAVFRLRVGELVARPGTRDEQGHLHLRYARVLNGLPVWGEELVVHVDETGRVYSANGSARGGDAGMMPSVAGLSREALESAALALLPGGRVQGESRLLYVRADADGRLKLARELVVEHVGGREHVFVDVLAGTPVLRFPEFHTAMYRVVYTKTGTGNVLSRNEGAAPTGNAVVDSAYDNMGRFYTCYQGLFGRDSYDNAGGKLTALVVPQGTSTYWDGAQLVCNDSTNSSFGPLCSDPDAVIHELAHGVTSSTSNLTYSGESGGLNEAMSDIAAAFCSSRESGSWSTGADIWKISEVAWTPSTPGDALRYMDDPFRDGASLDYYPGYSSSTDVHYSSGIANLAFALLSKGGTHPRGKTSVSVTGIGVERAARLFYKANQDCFTANTSFALARACTEQAATALGYPTASVTAAWQAVGVGSAPAPAVCPALANGSAVTGLSGAAGGASCAYPIAVPAGASNLRIETSGGTGDVDPYVKAGGIPTATTYDCRPYQQGSAESCVVASPPAGTVYYAVLRGFSAYSGVSLKASFTLGSATYSFPNLSGAAGSSSQLWAYPAVAGRPVTFTVAPSPAGTSGDVDLYVRFGAAPTLSTYDCRPYLGGNSERCTLTPSTSGVYYVLLQGYSAYSGVDLTISQ